MQIPINKRHVIYVIGTIIFGALGSGLWDLAIKPSLAFTAEFFVDVVLGAFKGVQNTIYADIASLDREITGRMLLSFGMGGMMGVVTVLVFRTFWGRNKEVRKLSAAPSKFYVALFGLFIFVFTTFTVGQTGYVISKQNDFLQLKRIVSPYLSEDERLKIDSEFSLIDSMEEYFELMDKMKIVASENDVEIPGSIK
ncbi:hypothetical protein [Chromohalobacter moromii]|uniref:Uncharacterized protein n=1 Tax=Chromohalobacter moromii TaxID=2860329 RepID=A0A9X2X1G6_9GAMM|nr:hypothetical protein [Chromohalobacter moromii]MCK2045470.1 hypothetical protein [Chromohalobacter moromii]MCT8504863.1 hypothetical protein [Chromohalobacter moromii]